MKPGEMYGCVLSKLFVNPGTELLDIGLVIVFAGYDEVCELNEYVELFCQFACVQYGLKLSLAYLYLILPWLNF